MEIKETLAQLIDRSRTRIDHAVIAVELKALDAPRPLRDIPQKQLDKTLARFSLAVIVGVYKLRSNKAFSFALVDRRLNKFGRTSAFIDIALGVPIVLLLVHERWVRSETPKSLDEIVDELLKRAGYPSMR